MKSPRPAATTTRLVREHPVLSLLGVGVLAVGGVLIAIGSSNNAPSTSSVTCTGVQSHDTKALQDAISATTNNGAVNIAAGTCNLNANLPVKRAMTINGAGATATFIVQWARENIYQITSPGVTIESMSLDVGTHNPGIPPVQKNPVPAALFSAQSNTTLRDLFIKAGTGFGFRITGPSPCDGYKTHGTVVSNVSVVNTGSGGFAAADFDCTDGATIADMTINGDYLALYKDINVTLDGLAYTPDNKPCQAPVFVTTTPTTKGIALRDITGGGHVIIKPSSRGVTVTNDTVARGC